MASYTFSEAVSIDKRDKSSKKVSKGKSKRKLRLMRERRLLKTIVASATDLFIMRVYWKKGKST